MKLSNGFFPKRILVQKNIGHSFPLVALLPHICNYPNNKALSFFESKAIGRKDYFK
jgi:hypothetical protein